MITAAYRAGADQQLKLDAERINQAWQEGADQELEALLTWLRIHHFDNLASDLLAARRPKPPSLKEQALEDLHIAFDTGCFSERQADTIRRALEQLPQ